MDLNHVRQLMRSLYWSTWEREYQLATARTRSPWGNYSRSMMEAVASMEKAPGVNPRPGRVPEQELLTPETWFRMAAELGVVSGRIIKPFRVFGAKAIYRRKGGVGRYPSQPHHPSAPPPSWPRPGMVWRPWASPGLVLLAHGVFW